MTLKLRRSIASATTCALLSSACAPACGRRSSPTSATTDGRPRSGDPAGEPAVAEKLTAIRAAANAAHLPSLLDQLPSILSLARRSSFDVAAKGAELGPDPDAAIRFVRDQVRFDAYEGVLRGARGTLMARAGNAFDKAVLLAALLRHHDFEVRFRTARLPGHFAERLADRAFEPRVESVPAPTTVALHPEVEQVTDGLLATSFTRFFAHVDSIRAALGVGRVTLGDAPPAPTKTLRDEAARHCWVEYRKDQNQLWIPIDPAAGDRTAIDALGTTASTFAELPDESYQRVTIRLRAEYRRRGGLEGQDLLRYEASAADLHGAVVVLEPSLSAVGTEWHLTYALSVSGVTTTADALRGAVDTGLAGGLGSGAASLGRRMFGGAGSSELVGAVLEFEFRTPSGRVETVRRVMLDLLGPAARAAHKTDGPLRAVPLLSGVPAPLLQLQAMSFSSGPLDPGFLAASLRTAELNRLRTHLPALVREPASTAKDDLESIAEVIPDSLVMLAQSFHAYSAIARITLETGSIRYYEAMPRLAIASLGFGGSQDGRSIQAVRQLDLRRNEVRVISRTDSGRMLVWANVLRGVLDGVIEETIAGDLSGTGGSSTSMSAVTVIEQVGLSQVTRLDLRGLQQLQLGDDERSRLTADLNASLVVIGPPATATIDGERRYGWWRVDAISGETLSVTDSGFHGQENKLFTSFSVRMMNTRFAYALLAAIGEGTVVVVRTTWVAGAILGGIAAVIAALCYGYSLGQQHGRDQAEREQRARDAWKRHPHGLP